jgi:tol-pal system protein YbgF
MSLWRRRSRPALAFLAGLLFAGVPVSSSLAQEPPQAGQTQAAKPQGGDSLSARLGRLEEKVQSLQVTIGTLESFSRAKPGTPLSVEAPPPLPQAPAQSDLGPRIDALETQITALTSHLEQIGRQMSALEAKLSALEAAPPPPAAPLPPQAEPPPLRQGEAPIPPPQDEPLPLRQGEAPTPPAAPADPATASIGAPSEAEENADPSKPRWFGPKPGSDELAALLEGQGDSDAGPPGSDKAPRNLTAPPPGVDAQTLYQQGYAALLQKDYGAAEATFRQLVEAYPDNALAGDAQYWLGETYYVRGQYKNAADAFLKGYKKYKAGQKAPDTLLKLGMSLAELGQKDAACSTFNELKAKYPGAPAHIGDEAKAWRKKTGC